MARRPSALIVGGGFYGCALAVHLARRDWDVRVFEREQSLMSRASLVNQARLHNGYHYPRSFRTAVSSRANLPRFAEVYPAAVDRRFRALYAIARRDSKVDAAYFRRFCAACGIPLEPASAEDKSLFDKRLIEDVFLVEEPAFDASKLRDVVAEELAAANVPVLMGTSIAQVAEVNSKQLYAETACGEQYTADWVFNCAYAAGHHVDGRATAARPLLTHKISEIVLLRPPPELRERGVTVMDGPFFSTMPFPARGMHSFTHVRYTHHMAWNEGGETAPLAKHPFAILEEYLSTGTRSRLAWMLRDARRYLPVLADSKMVESLFDVKTLVARTEIDDARPIHFHRDPTMPRFISILGGKIDNIFDILEFIDDLMAQEQA